MTRTVDKGGVRPLDLPIEPVGILNVSQVVYERLKDGIVNHRFAPGEQLNVKELARQLGTSTTPVVQAVLRLSEEGLVKVLSRRGTFVADPDPDEIRQLSEAREAIETYAIRLAIRRIDGASLVELERLIDEWKRLVHVGIGGDGRASANTLDEKDGEFHCRLVEESANPFLVVAYRRIDAQVRAFVRVKFGGYYQHVEDVAAAGHDSILNGLREKDEEAAVQAVRDHIWGVYSLYLDLTK